MAELDPDVKIREISWVRKNLLYFVGMLAVVTARILIQKGLVAVTDFPLSLRTMYAEMARLFDKYGEEDF